MLKIEPLQFGYTTQQRMGIEETMDFGRGELVALLGRNGTGKTTFIRTLARLHSPQQGTFWVDSKNVADFSAAQYAQKVSFVHTQTIPNNYLDIRSLVSLGRYPHTNFWGTLTAEDQTHIDQALQQAGISLLASKQLHQCSDGEKQLALLARAIAQDTPILLLDEITAHLDFINRHRIFELLVQLAQTSNKLIFIATHELDLALRYATRLLLFQPPVVQSAMPTAFANADALLEVWKK